MRNKIKFLLLVAVLLVLSSCAGKSSYMMPATNMYSRGVPSNKAVVYFMRPSGMGFAVNFQIWDGDKLIGLSQAKSYFAYETNPGNHLFMGFAENQVAVNADLAAGKEYYIGTNVRMGAWKARMGFTPVTRGSELWDKVDLYKQQLNFVAVDAAKAQTYEAAKKAEAKKHIDFFTNGEGRGQVLTLSKKDGR